MEAGSVPESSSGETQSEIRDESPEQAAQREQAAAEGQEAQGLAADEQGQGVFPPDAAQPGEVGPGPGPAGTDPAGPPDAAIEQAPAEEAAPTDEHNPDAPLNDQQAVADASPSPEPTTEEDVDPTSGSSEGASSEAPSVEAGPLVGTTTEQQPGVGGTGDHPAPATTVSEETGLPRQHGEGDDALGSAPIGDSVDLQSGGDVSKEASEALGAVQDSSDQNVDVERPDIGTPSE